MKEVYIQRRDKEDNSFVRLQNEAFEMLHALCGNIWTDYNAHDPGVTISETFHYALMELQYTMRFPVEYYLKDDYGKLGLYAAGEITLPSIVTTRDYERLITENIQDVKNCRVTVSAGHRYFIEAETDNTNESVVKKAIEELYHSHRNLCETLGGIEIRKNIAHPKTFSNSNEPEFEQAEKKAAEPKIPAGYDSIQNHFPDCYGVNSKGIPAGSSWDRKAKILQLKAYLLIYDFLIANVMHQIGNIDKSLELPEGTMPPFSLDFSVEDMDLLIDNDKFSENNLRDNNFTHHQKSNYLDILDVIYGEDSKAFLFNRDNVPLSNEKRARLVKALPGLNAHRFRSFNVLSNKEDDVPVIKRLIAALFGHDIHKEIPVNRLFGIYRLQLVSDKRFFSEYKNLDMEPLMDYFKNHALEYEIETIAGHESGWDDSLFDGLENDLNFFWHNVIFESLLQYGSDTANYRLVNNKVRKIFILIFKIPGSEKWINLGFFTDKQKLGDTANLLRSFIKMLRGKTQMFYLVEHILLNDNESDYNRLSVIIPSWAQWNHRQTDFEELMRERLPAHLNLNFVWISSNKIYAFENAYYMWRDAMAQRNESEYGRLSALVRELIN